MTAEPGKPIETARRKTRPPISAQSKPPEKEWLRQQTSKKEK
jgi:hypothetical protein